MTQPEERTRPHKSKTGLVRIRRALLYSFAGLTSAFRNESACTPAPGAKRRTVGIAVLLVSTYLVMAANGGLFLLVVSLKQIAGDFDWPRTVPSLAYAFFFAGTGIGGIAMGWWFDRSGAGPVTLLGLTMIGTGALLAASIDSRWQLYLVYGVMIGLLGYASIYGPLSINVMRWFEHRRGFAVGLVTAGEGIGGTIWPPIRLDRQLHARVPDRSGVQRRQPDHRPRPHQPHAGRRRRNDAAGPGVSGGPGDFGRRGMSS